MTTTPGPEFPPAESADKWFSKWESLGKPGSATDHDTEDDEGE